MSYHLSLGGVACTTKSTILKQLKISNLSIRMSDYKELHEKYNFEHSVGSLLYAAHRYMTDGAGLDYATLHVYDRHPMEALVYETMNKGIDLERTGKIFEDCVNMGFARDFKSIIMRVKPGTESHIVRMMKERGNGIDAVNEAYVTNQNERFEIFARTFNADEYIIDCSKDISEQQKEIEQHIYNMIYNWYYIDESLYVFEYRLPIVNEKIAGFDLDGTLIVTQSGEVYPKNSEDWKWKYSDIYAMFCELIKNNYTIVVVTNQLGISAGKVKSCCVEKKITNICTIMGLPMIVLVSSKHDKYRKPSTGTMEFLTRKYPQIDVKKSFFCGDNVNGTLSNDSDYAKACGMKFMYDFEYFECPNE
ncbi:nicotinamide riboside kinase 1 [Alphabaculovirus altersperidaniae]|uniref:Nicotinamide riboside kinase 1 n=1 Tax=Spodoptera eridania nucleopolyhedrovirus TaxID=2315721 RepID=A0ABX6TSA7_9ABAC|nr:nicotinamide riboside kinase 1 [Spodoptera eridania nucleopolyhedrovirus]QNV47872.1 nicotinamide riboside kinase 1 [Spodoptera eridania nucleopolyhedrovirus]